MPRGYRWCKGGRKRGRGRPCFYRNISKIPKAEGFIPIESKRFSSPSSSEESILVNEPIYVYLDELEAMRLVDGENLTQDEAGALMGISRGSIWRLLQSGRRKLIIAIFEKREIRIPFDELEDNNKSESIIT
ncbi:MAG: DUF134 domain-containing protein [Candidatus Helarchaeota archaeon]|nr:DUF134 domain-containing protein [Candidatus Helarchaeota archaeon]